MRNVNAVAVESTISANTRTRPAADLTPRGDGRNRFSRRLPLGV